MTWKKTDSNQQEIVEALRKCGFSVAVTSSLGKGFPDLVISRAGVTHLCELKDENQPPSKRKLTPDEEAFHKVWKGKIILAKNLEEILNAF